MKVHFYGIKSFFLVLFFTFLGMSVVVFSGSNIANAESTPNIEDSHVILYPSGYVTNQAGASSYNGISNVKSSAYFIHQDYYNLASTDTLAILPHYKTYQQTTEITCGPAAALTVMHHFGNTSWDEISIAKVMETKPKVGTDTKGMVTFFKMIGWEVTSSLMTADKTGITFKSEKEFKDFIIRQLKNNTPIMVENIDWGGHWRVIIGYDTMGTETTADDILILADSYDTADHCQDGYVVNSAQKFYYMWFDAHMLPKGQQQQQWVVAKPF